MADSPADAVTPETRPGTSRVRPLVEASETYRWLTEAVAGARETVHMAYWAVQPNLTLDGRRTKDAAAGRPLPGDEAPDWADLLAQAARRGVTVRLILSDFDPILVPGQHRDAWHSYRRFCEIRDGLPPACQENLQVICSRHQAATGLVPRLLAQPLLHARLRRAVAALTGGDGASVADRRADAPMLWRHMTVRGGRKPRPSHRSILPVYPAVHHEKSCVVDGAVGFVGGLDIDRERFDTPEHRSLRPWHDVAARLDGPVVAAVAAHFANRWREESEVFRHLHAEATARRPPGVFLPALGPLSPVRDAPETAERQTRAPEDGPRIVRTVTGHRRSPFALGPNIRASGSAKAVEALIARAQRRLYIENQFLRSDRVAGWLARQATAAPDLRLIVVLPLAPERLGGGWNAANRHGQYLQRRALRRIADAFGDRFGLYTLLTRAPPPTVDDPVRDHLTEDDQALGSDEIYVHAKLMIADDRTAMIGSANLNERSLSVDTETGVIWTDDRGVATFREDVWRRHLGEPARAPGDPFDIWDQAAHEDARRPPSERRGFVVPMSIERATVQARRLRVIPSRLL
ncbi:phospholipase D family protein [Roseospira navarrensis]|uniref:Phospholipase D n=1 Tax=Roseospira navarrensis TaxID=140058 RepID=A0A7X1ZIP1_9PROT|nr:phospholipase D-like domain-containing protein [Roseospira navarrensis]MQX37950.1 hypothetical protein [Roseospira navarrensis]